MNTCLSAGMLECHVHAWYLWEPQQDIGFPGTRVIYRWLWAAMCVLETERVSSARAANTLDHWASSPVLTFNVMGLYVSVFLHVTYIHVHGYTKPGVQPHWSFFRCCLPFYVDTASHIGNGFARAHCPADSIICLPLFYSSGVTSLSHCISHFYIGSGTQTRVLMLVGWQHWPASAHFSVFFSWW